MLPELDTTNQPLPVGALEGILALFETAPIVALVEAHWLRQEHALIAELLLDARFGEIVDAVVVEFGNASHQPLLDRFLAGENVDPAPVWRDCVGGYNGVFESHVYRRFFEVARGRPFRVLLGDPPFDPATARPGEFWNLVERRDEHFASLVAHEVLDRGGRVLLLAGGGHLGRLSDEVDGNVVQRLERSHPGCTAVVVPHYFFGDVLERRREAIAEINSRLAAWPIPSMAPISGTWLADIDASLFSGGVARHIEPGGVEIEIPAPFVDADGHALETVRLGDFADAYLYLGALESLVLVRPESG